MKSLTTKRLSDFMDAANNLNPVNHKVSSIVADSKPTFEKYSIINLEPAMLETNEIVDEAPLLFVGKTSIANPMQNLPDIIESYKIFVEISSIEDKDVEDQFRSVSLCNVHGDFLFNNLCIPNLHSPHLDKEDVSMIEELDPLEGGIAEPVKKVRKTKKKKQKLVEPVDSVNKQKKVM